jgi:hypothetical protein
MKSKPIARWPSGWRRSSDSSSAAVTTRTSIAVEIFICSLPKRWLALRVPALYRDDQ